LVQGPPHTFKFSLAAPETATWVYVLLTLILFVFVIGLGLGKLLNRDWNFGSHLCSLVLVLVFAGLAAYAVFNLRGISRMEAWFQRKRGTIRSPLPIDRAELVQPGMGSMSERCVAAQPMAVDLAFLGIDRADPTDAAGAGRLKSFRFPLADGGEPGTLPRVNSAPLGIFDSGVGGLTGSITSVVARMRSFSSSSPAMPFRTFHYPQPHPRARAFEIRHLAAPRRMPARLYFLSGRVP
jgi:hypothetical protein